MRSRSAGFTLIELLVVVLIIGVLAAIAIPRFMHTKDQAYLASMKSDLHNLATAESAYFADNQTYTTMLTVAQYHVSPGVMVTIQSADKSGWAATATHNAVAKTCSMSVGTGSSNEGTPVCN